MMERMPNLSIPALRRLCGELLTGCSVKGKWQYGPQLATLRKGAGGIAVTVNLRVLSDFQRNKKFHRDFSLLWPIRYIEVSLCPVEPGKDYLRWLAERCAREDWAVKRLYLPRGGRANPWGKKDAFGPWELYCLWQGAEQAARELKAEAQAAELLAVLRARAALPEVHYVGKFPRHSLFYREEPLPDPRALAEEPGEWASGVLLRQLCFAGGEQVAQWMEDPALRSRWIRAAEEYLTQSAGFLREGRPEADLYGADCLAVILKTNGRVQRILACYEPKPREREDIGI